MDNSIQAHQKELCNKLWAMANALRGNMEAYEFKNYILGMIFYYYLSDKIEKYMVNLLKDDGISYEEAWADPEYKEAVVEEALRDLGYVIEPQFLFRKMVKMVENRSFDIEFLQKAINSLMESTIGNDSQDDFDGLFSDMQLDSTKLGHTVKDRHGEGHDKDDGGTESDGGLHTLRDGEERAHPEEVGEDHVIHEDRPDEKA